MDRISYAGTYERTYPRNQLMIAALRRAGFAVREVHASIWQGREDKSSQLGLAYLAQLAGNAALAYCRLVLRLLAELPQTDTVMVGYIGQLDMLLLGSLARLARRHVVFNPLVTLTDTLVEDRGLVAAGSISARAVALVDRLSLLIAQRVIVDTAENGDYLVRRFGIRPDKIRVVNVGADEAVFRAFPVTAVYDRQEPLSDRQAAALRVLFYGKMIPLHGVDTVLRAAALLQNEGMAHFRIVGSGQLGPDMRALACELGLSNVEFVPWVPFDELPAEINQADVVLGVFGETDKAARVVPNKVFQAMAMGAPIITRDGPAIRNVLADGESALLVPPASPEALASALRRLTDRNLRDRLGAGARQAFQERGSLDALARQVSIALRPATNRSERIDRLEAGRSE